MERKLAAILAADVVGYSRLMGKDDTGTLSALQKCEVDLIEPTVTKHNGRIFKRMGDGYLAEFASAVDAVECAHDWQNQLQATENQPLSFRIGVNLGEVIADAGDIYGDGVNVAARLETLAQPGCIAISDDAFRQIRDRLEIKFDDLGMQELKNIPRPVRVWEWRCKFALPSSLCNVELKLPKKPSIVLMPLRNLSGDEEQDSLAEGLRIDVQNALTKVSGVFLIAAGSANALRGAASREAGVGLGVQYVLQGTVRKAGNRVRVSVELTDTVSDQIVWTERYDRTLDNTFELQDEIAARILTALNVELVAGEQAKIWHKTLKDIKALELFYKGVHAFFKMDRDEMVSARQFFKTVAKMHPDAAIGATMVAMTYWFDIQRGWANSSEESRKLAYEWAAKASAMEDADGQAQTVLSHVELMNGNFDAALTAGRAAVETRPACANANGFYANVLHYCGEQDAAIRHIKLAMRYHPLNPPFFKNVLAAAHLAKGEFDTAIEIAKQTIGAAPSDMAARLILASGYERSKQHEQAEAIGSEIRKLDPNFSVKKFRSSQFYRSAEYADEISADLQAAGLPI